MLKAALLVSMLLTRTAVERSLFGAKALYPGANALRTGTADRFVGESHGEFDEEVVPC